MIFVWSSTKSSLYWLIKIDNCIKPILASPTKNAMKPILARCQQTLFPFHLFTGQRNTSHRLFGHSFPNGSVPFSLVTAMLDALRVGEGRIPKIPFHFAGTSPTKQQPSYTILLCCHWTTGKVVASDAILCSLSGASGQLGFLRIWIAVHDLLRIWIAVHDLLRIWIAVHDLLFQLTSVSRVHLVHGPPPDNARSRRQAGCSRAARRTKKEAVHQA